MRRLHLLLVLVLGCAPRDAARESVPTLTRLHAHDSLAIPETVVHDADQDVYFVSNVNAHATARDNNGFISRFTPDGGGERAFIRGGANGVTLHAPKGMAFSGDTLWVADVDVVRAFDRRTGAPIRSIDLRRAGARFLNDLTRVPDGALYATDSGLEFDSAGQMTHPGPDRIFRIADGMVTVVAEGDTLARPNGLEWDSRRQAFILGSLGSKTLFEWRLGNAPSRVAGGPGGYDGVVVLADGRVLVSSLDDGSVNLLVGDTLRALVAGLPDPANIGFDPKRGRILIPLLSANRVEIWQMRDN